MEFFVFIALKMKFVIKRIVYLISKFRLITNYRLISICMLKMYLLKVLITTTIYITSTTYLFYNKKFKLLKYTMPK